VPMTMHFVPKHHFRDAAEHAREFLPVVRTLFKDLKKFPDAEFVEVQDGDQHVQIRTHDGKLQIEVHDSGENVHVLVPLSTLDDVVSQIQESTPGA